MAEIRFNYGDKFTQTTDTNTGIGSTIPAGKLDVAGNTKAGSLRVTGIATLSSVSGFVNTKLTTSTQDMIVEAGNSGSVSGEVVVSTGQTISVSTGATTGQGGIHSLKVYETFMPPVGGTADRPTDVKPGMVYYNKDFKTIEFWDGNFWKQVDNTTRRGRGVIAGGYVVPARQDTIDFIEISSQGNALNFGDLNDEKAQPGPGATNSRGLFAGGMTPGATNQIEYITIPSEGNGIDFGDLTRSKYPAGVQSPTRAVFAGGYTPNGENNSIEFSIFASLGNTTSFGDLTQARGNPSSGGNSIRGLYAGGWGGPASMITSIDFITIASEGNAKVFGDLTEKMSEQMGGCANSVRCTFAGGNNPGQNPLNTISFVTIASAGNAQDFGDLTLARRGPTSLSDSHGGLGGY